MGWLRSRRSRWVTLCVLLQTTLVGPASAGQETEWIRARTQPGLRADLAALLVQGLPGGGLPLATAAFPELAVAAHGAGGNLRLPVRFEVPGFALAPLVGDGGSLKLEFYLYALTQDGPVAGHLALELEIAAARFGEPPPRSGLRVFGDIELPPGRYSLRFLVFEPSTRGFGLDFLEVTLPAAGEVPWITPPRIPESCPDWLSAALDEDPLDPGTAAARPVIRSGARVELTASLIGSLLVESPNPRVTVRLHGRGGLPDHEIPADLQLFEAAEGSASMALAFEVPHLASGIYGLSLGLGGDSAQLFSRAVDTWVLGPDSPRILPPPLSVASGPDCGPTWGDILSSIAAGQHLSRTVPPESDDEEDRGEGSLRRRLRQGYRRALLRFTESGSLETGAQELADAESSLIAEDPSRLLALRRGELAVARAIDALEPQALLPVMVLHHAAYLEHFRRQGFALATHSRMMVTALAELMGRRLSGSDGRSMVADVLTSLAEYAERLHMSIPSQQLLEQALEIDTGHEAARLLLAVSYERLGRYLTAREQLRALVASNSKNMEARLRLAIMMERAGDLEACEHQLRKIVRERPSGWLLSLAYQTLARVLARHGDFDGAVTLLEEAVEVLPDDQRLQLQLAYCLDRAGRPQDAATRLERVPIDISGRQRTPRFHYTESPAAALVPLRERLAQSVTVSLPRLARALGGETGP